MRQYESPNPGDFAIAVFGDGPITGVEVGSRDSNSGKIYTWADSVKSGVNQVMSKLIPYHFNPTLLTNKLKSSTLNRQQCGSSATLL